MATESTVPFRPLGIIASFLEKAGFDVSYVYEDLVFPNHNGFLLKMGQKGEEISVFFNEESDSKNRDDIFERLDQLSPEEGLSLSRKGSYKMISDEQAQTINIEFIDQY